MNKIKQEDVWGTFDLTQSKRTSKGMIVAQGYSFTQEEYDAHPLRAEFFPRICPIWRDELPYKSVTVVCDREQEREVRHWLSYVHGGGNIEKVKELPDNKIAIRSNYMCW